MKEKINNLAGLRNQLSVKDIHKSRLDRVLEFAMLTIVNPTAFLRFGGRRQFFIYEKSLCLY